MGELINYTGFFIVLIIILAQLGIKLSALLGAAGILVQDGVWFEKNDYVLVRNAILSDVLEAFRAEGITIPYPHITIENGLPVPEDEERKEILPGELYP